MKCLTLIATLLDLLAILAFLVIAIIGCGADEPIREPDLPVIDIGAYDIDRTYFVFQLESDRTVDRPIYVWIVKTYRGHYSNDRFRRFEIRDVGGAARILAGLQEYAGAAYRTIGPWKETDHEFSKAEVPFQEGERGIVTSVVIEISQLPPHQKWYLENGHPFTVGVSTLMFTTHGNIVRR